MTDAMDREKINFQIHRGLVGAPGYPVRIKRNGPRIDMYRLIHAHIHRCVYIHIDVHLASGKWLDQLSRNLEGRLEY